MNRIYFTFVYIECRFCTEICRENQFSLLGDYDFEYRWGNRFSPPNDIGYDGWFVGGGFSYGYQWIMGKHWNLETELGIGYAYLDYDKYLHHRCGRFIDTGHRNY